MTLPRPRRLTPPAPIGSMLKRIGVKRVNLALSDLELDRDVLHLANIRQCPCLHCGMDPCYEAAHLRMASAAFGKASGMGKKPPAKWATPLCPDHHRILKNCQHDQSEAVFWHALGINPLITCEQLYAQRGDLVAMRAVVFVAIATRGKR